MVNKYTRTTRTTLLKNKLDKMSTKLQEAVANPDFATQEAYVAEAASLLSSFYSGLDSPIFTTDEVWQETLPSLDDYNNMFSQIKDDLDILFQELENVETVVVSNFNYAMTESLKANRIAKEVAAKLGNYVLYSKDATKDAIFFKDSFNNTLRVDLTSKLLNASQCEVNQVEGIITLPINQTQTITHVVTADPVVNPGSNGVAGNNHESQRLLSDDIEAILDGNPDTWFEYERVLSKDDGIALSLDLTLNFEDEKIINYVRVNPNNFGTYTQIFIEKIETSIDGKTFISIKDDIPLADFLSEDEANIFTLAPSTSKYSGQGVYSFTPRKARYVHFIFKQNTPYIISTSSGQKYRYAIGLRDIELKAVAFEPIGELVSVAFSPGDEIRKVLLLTSQNPLKSSVLASIEHRITPDGGNSWITISPKGFEGDSAPGLITFNGIEADSVETTTPVDSLKYKVVLARNPDAFYSGDVSLKEKILPKTELVPVPTRSPYKVTLTNTPITGTVAVVDPSFGSRGIEDLKYNLATGLATSARYRLPWKNIPKDISKGLVSSGVLGVINTDPEIITIEGETWTRTNSLLTSGSTDTHYELDYTNGLFRTGNGTNGQALTKDTEVSIRFTPERLTPNSAQIASLCFPTSGDKEQVTITRRSQLAVGQKILKRGETIHPLSIEGTLVSSGIVPPIDAVFTKEEIFVDGYTELEHVGDWSVDYENAIIYTRDPISTTNNLAISYHYSPEVVLDPDDWEFVDPEKGLIQKIKILDNAWQTEKISDETLPTGSNVTELWNNSVVEGSIQFTVSSGITDPFETEVSFIDGYTEFSDAIPTSEVIVDPTSSGSLYTIALSNRAITTDLYRPRFSNTDLFDSEPVASEPIADGEWWIHDENPAEIQFFYSGTLPSDLGHIHYYYSDTTKTLAGLYSVDYSRGTIYSYTTVPTGEIKATYYYTDYTIQYNIARGVTSFSVDGPNVIISDKEVLSIDKTPAGNKRFSPGKYLQISYKYADNTREDIADLEPYFTPVLKEYCLKILTKSRLF